MTAYEPPSYPPPAGPPPQPYQQQPYPQPQPQYRWGPQPGAAAPPPSAGYGGVNPVQAAGGGGWRGRRLLTGGLVVAVLALCVGGAVLAWATDDPEGADVGDCMRDGVGFSDLRTVACSDGLARYRVVGRIDDRTENQFDAAANPCTSYQGAKWAFWAGERGEEGHILCLAPVGG